MEKIRQMEAKIDNLETKNNYLEQKLDEKLDNHFKILENKLANLNLAYEEK